MSKEEIKQFMENSRIDQPATVEGISSSSKGCL